MRTSLPALCSTLALLTACENKPVELAPPPPSPGLVVAPPGALGARPATLQSTAESRLPPDPGELDPEDPAAPDEGDEGPHGDEPDVTHEADPDSGVAL